MNEKVTRMLKNYRSYRYAVSNGIAPFVEDDTRGMPMAFDYGPRSPGSLLGRGNIVASQADYRAYKRVVQAIDGAVAEVLDDDMQMVIRYKYLERNTMSLMQIAEKMHCHERRVKYLHKKALNKLEHALVFIEEPEIINLDKTIDNIKGIKISV